MNLHFMVLGILLICFVLGSQAQEVFSDHLESGFSIWQSGDTLQAEEWLAKGFMLAPDSLKRRWLYKAAKEAYDNAFDASIPLLSKQAKKAYFLQKCHHYTDLLIYPAYSDFWAAQAMRRKAFAFDRAYISDSAAKYHSLAIPIYQKQNHLYYLANCQHQVSTYYIEKGEYVQAIALLKQAIQTYKETLKVYEDEQKNPKRIWERLGFTYIDIGIASKSKGDYLMALQYLDSAKWVATYETFNPYLSCYTFTYRAESFLMLAQPIKAQAASEQAIACLKEENYDAEDSATLARSHGFLARAYQAQGAYTRAWAHFDSAISLLKRLHGDATSRDIAKQYLFQGRCYIQAKQYEQALTAFQKGLFHLLPAAIDTADVHQLPTETAIDQAENLLFRLLAAKGKAFYAWAKASKQPAHLESSVASYLLMIRAEQVFRYGQSVGAEASRLIEAERSHDRHEDALAAAYERLKRNGSPEAQADFWELLETSKAVVLAEHLQRMQVPEELAHPAKPISLTETQKHLQPNQSLVSYFWGDSTCYGVKVTPEGKPTIRIIPNDSMLTEAVRQYKKALTQQADSGFQLFEQQAKILYQRLVAPFHPLQEKLIIIPDGQLFNLPFEAFIPPNDQPISPIQYLIDEHSISYLPSATIGGYLAENRLSSYKNHEWLGIAPGNFANPLYPPLKESAEVLDSIAVAYGEGFMLKDKWATKEAFISLIQANRDLAFIHLSTHAEASQDTAFIVFSGAQDTSILSVEELYNLRTDAVLVVLSACKTGSGKVQQGEGVMSLARAFFHAGCQSVIASQWEVKHAPNSFIMKQFYRHLAAGLPTDEALRQAKLDFRNPDNHGLWLEANRQPWHWAAMIAMGNMQALPPSPPAWPWIGWGSFAFVLGLLAVFWGKRVRRL